MLSAAVLFGLLCLGVSQCAKSKSITTTTATAGWLIIGASILIGVAWTDPSENIGRSIIGVGIALLSVSLAIATGRRNPTSPPSKSINIALVAGVLYICFGASTIAGIQNPLPRKLASAVATHSVAVLEWFSVESAVVTTANSPIQIAFNEGANLRVNIVTACTGVGVLSLVTALSTASARDATVKISVTVLTTSVIYLSNLVRISVVGLAYTHQLLSPAANPYTASLLGVSHPAHITFVVFHTAGQVLSAVLLLVVLSGYMRIFPTLQVAICECRTALDCIISYLR